MKKRWGVALVALAAVLVTCVTLAASLPHSSADGDTAWPGWGFTHTQFSADDGEPEAVATITDALKASPPMVQAQHIMGWGVDNPEPEPGNSTSATSTFEWTSSSAPAAFR